MKPTRHQDVFQNSAKHLLSISRGLFFLLIPAVGIAIWNGNMTAIEIKAFIVPVFYVIIFGLLGARLVLRDTISVPRDAMIFLTGLYGILMVASFFQTTGSSIHSTALVPQLCGVLTFILVVFCFTEADIPKLVGVLLATAAVSSTYGIMQYFRIDRLKWDRQTDQVFSFFGNKNYFALFLLLMIPLGGYYMIPPARRMTVVTAVFLTVLMVAALIFSNSRGAYGGLFVAVTVSVVLLAVRSGKPFFRGTKKTVFLPMTLIAVTIAAIAMPKQIKHDFVVKFREIRTDAEYRMTFYRAALEVVSKSPFFGVGPGNFQLSHVRNTTHKVNTYDPNRVLAHVHNDFLETWAEYGIFALLAYGGVLATFALKWVAAFKSEEDPNRRAMLTVIACSVIGYLFYSQMTVAGRYVSSVFYFWLVMGIGYLCLKGTDCHAISFSNPIKKSRVISVACVTVIALAVVGTLKKELANYASDIYLKMAYDAYEEKKADRALAYLDKAIRLGPGSVEAHYQRGGVSFGLNRIDQAADDYMTVEKLAPGYVNVYYNLALCHYKMGEYEKSAREAETGFQAFPDYPPSLLLLVYSTFRLNRFQDALRFCDIYLEKCNTLKHVPACGDALELKKNLIDKLKKEGGKHVSDT